MKAAAFMGLNAIAAQVIPLFHPCSSSRRRTTMIAARVRAQSVVRN
jgi:hypothetical protein